jgi:hypothetical protein
MSRLGLVILIGVGGLALSFGAWTSPALAMPLPQIYGDDLTTSDNAISGGDTAPYVLGNAFDDDSGTLWGSSQGSPTVSGFAYIGQDFGAGTEYEIRRFTIRQYYTATSEIGSLVVQYSDNGAIWSTLDTITILENGDLQVFDLGASSPARYWRLLANDNPSAGHWYVAEVEMFILIATPTPTPTSTATITPTPTLTPTPRYEIEGSTSGGEYFLVERRASYADITQIGILAGIAGIGVVGLGLALAKRQ